MSAALDEPGIAASESRSETEADRAEANQPYVDLLPVDLMDPRPVDWLWNGYLIGGRLNILAGAPGTGKTTLALAMAATVSTGGLWPDGTRAPQGGVLVYSNEDTGNDVLSPRLRACGADTSQIRIIDQRHAGRESRKFDPSQDIIDLQWAMLREKLDWKLIIIDTITSVTSGNSHNNGAVRKDLAPLGKLAEETGCAILCISHFTKGSARRAPLERVAGSIAFGAYARLVLGVAPRKEEKGGKFILTRAKSNLGVDGGGFVYDIEEAETPGSPGIFTSRIVWHEALEGSARRVLELEEVGERGDEREARTAAMEFLQSLLADGRVKVKDLDPRHATAYNNRGLAWHAKGDLDRAIADHSEAIRLNPQSAGAYVNRGFAWYDKSNPDRAMADYNEAIRLDPKFARAYDNRGVTWHAKGDIDRAITEFNEALRLNPQFANAYGNRALAWYAKGDYERAIADYNEAIRLFPQFVVAYNGLAWIHATSKIPAFRNGSRAVEYAQKACELTGWKDPNLLDSLSAAYAESGNFSEAIRWQQKALESPKYANSGGDKPRARLELYRRGQPYRE